MEAVVPELPLLSSLRVVTALVSPEERAAMESLLQEADRLRAKGEALLPVNAATATIAFGRAAQLLCSLRLKLEAVNDPKVTAEVMAKLDAQVTELRALAKHKFLTFSKKAAFVLFADDQHRANLDDYFQPDSLLLKWDAFVEPLQHMDKDFADKMQEVTGEEKDFVPSPHVSTYTEMVSYTHTALHIRRAAKAAHAQLSHLSVEEFLARYNDEIYQWLVPPQQLRSFLEAHQSGDTLIAFMEMVSLMDRRMRDLLYYNNDVPRALPRKFQDILKLPTFQNLWGSTISVVLNVLLGTQEGLNLRNLLWHGFATKSQFDPSYFTFLCLAVFSLPPPPAPLRTEMLGEPRPLTDFHRFVPNLDFGLGTKVFPDVLRPEEIKEVNELIADNFLIVAGQEELWADAFRYFAQGHNYRALLVLLPLVEHAMRKLCLFLNDCPMRRGCKLDKILRPAMDDHSNLFYTAWPTPLMHALYDLFQWGECGGGLRHYLAHGSTQGNDLLPRDFADRCIAVALALCLPYRPTWPSLPDTGLLQRVWQFVAVDYRPCFHPKTLLQRELVVADQLWQEVAQQINDAAALPLPPPQSSPSAEAEKEEKDESASDLGQTATASSAETLAALARLIEDFGGTQEASTSSFSYDFSPFCTHKEQRRVDRLRRLVVRSSAYLRLVRDQSDAEPKTQKEAEARARLAVARPLLLQLLRLILLAVRKLWRVGAEGEGDSSGGRNKVVTSYLADLWNLMEKLRSLLDRNDWQRVSDIITFIALPPSAHASSLLSSLGSVLTSKEAKLYGGLLCRGGVC